MAFDYSDIGLNSNLQPINSLVGGDRGFVSSTEVSKNYERNSMGNYAVANLSAGKITAGTITAAVRLGGANIFMDGENTRIVINDGTNDVVLLGYGSGLF